MKFLSLIFLFTLIGCSGEDVARISEKIDDITVNATIAPIPALQPAGFAKLVSSTHSVKDLSFDITGTGGTSPLYYSGSARFSGTITFNQMTSFSNIYQQGGHNNCPISGVPVRFECQATISARVFSQCNVTTSSGNYVMKGAFFSARSSSDRTFDILDLCISGPCTGNIPCF